MPEPPTPSPPGPPESRRELNRRATHEAITAAALRLAREHGAGGFTVDTLAEAAGISRRTFFNYFPSIEAAVTQPVEEFLDRAFARLYERPADEPIVDAVLAAITGDVGQEEMALLCEVYSMSADDEQLERMQLWIWDKAQQKLEEGLKPRLPADSSELLTDALAGSIIACAKAAMRQASGQTAPGQAADPQAFHDLLLASLDLLRAGFNTNGSIPHPKDN
ncbi:TetR/AcrR family transcriptional regulator [Arthrobacter sp. I2-34]|uniref:TetR/AcrR family transcriptional regulator n=1 Tax=Arthrobacter hankyongi TaxID=2904801 RepID=A0ABS9L4S9_9MICC|nr:TetR family transcriptional regulator [Arthrobacter hankyongi]MCG2621692.1 TetR/AcrR family transcriptional regulator [Arthrobacter hankyongi]